MKNLKKKYPRIIIKYSSLTKSLNSNLAFLIMNNFPFQDNNDTYRYLSGIPVTPRTQFLQLSQPEVLQQYKLVIHYMRFAMAAYGWPIFMMMNTGTGLCKLMPYLRYLKKNDILCGEASIKTDLSSLLKRVLFREPENYFPLELSPFQMRHDLLQGLCPCLLRSRSWCRH